MNRSISSTWILTLLFVTGSSLFCGVTSCKSPAKKSTLRDNRRPPTFSELVARLESETEVLVGAPLREAKVSNSSSPALSLGDGDQKPLTAPELAAARQRLVEMQKLVESMDKQLAGQWQDDRKKFAAMSQTLAELSEMTKLMSESPTPVDVLPIDIEKLDIVKAALEAKVPKPSDSATAKPAESARVLPNSYLVECDNVQFRYFEPTILTFSSKIPIQTANHLLNNTNGEKDFMVYSQKIPGNNYEIWKFFPPINTSDGVPKGELISIYGDAFGRGYSGNGLGSLRFSFVPNKVETDINDSYISVQILNRKNFARNFRLPVTIREKAGTVGYTLRGTIDPSKDEFSLVYSKTSN